MTIHSKYQFWGGMQSASETGPSELLSRFRIGSNVVTK